MYLPLWSHCGKDTAGCWTCFSSERCCLSSSLRMSRAAGQMREQLADLPWDLLQEIWLLLLPLILHPLLFSKPNVQLLGKCHSYNLLASKFWVLDRIAHTYIYTVNHIVVNIINTFGNLIRLMHLKLNSSPVDACCSKTNTTSRP